MKIEGWVLPVVSITSIWMALPSFLRLKGRFWHERKTVLARVGSYLKGRIPEIVDVVIEDEWQLTDEANEQW
jgi:hypothetical protein